jgi:hypothetical protein
MISDCKPQHTQYGHPQSKINSQCKPSHPSSHIRLIPPFISSETPSLLRLQSLSSTLKTYTRSHPTFPSLNTYLNPSLSPAPLAIVCPTTARQVSQIISFRTTHSIPLTVRCGGHDSWGRSAVFSSLIIDLRELDKNVLSDDRKALGSKAV